MHFHCPNVVLRLGSFVIIAGLLGSLGQQALVCGLRGYRTRDRGRMNAVVNGRINTEVLLTGSSRTAVHMDPRIIGGALHRKAYNLGQHGVHLDLGLGLIKTYLAHNQKPQVLVQGLDLNYLSSSTNVFMPGQYIPYLGEQDLASRLYPLDSRYRIAAALPLYGISLYRCAGEGLVGLFHCEPKEDLIQGYSPRELKWQGDFESFRRGNPHGIAYEISPSGEAALRELLSLCRARGIRVILVYSPEYWEVKKVVVNRDEILNRFRQIAEEFTVPFLDYSENPLCKDKTKFYNSQHLNREGAELFSRDLGERLSSLLQVQTNRILYQPCL